MRNRRKQRSIEQGQPPGRTVQLTQAETLAVQTVVVRTQEINNLATAVTRDILALRKLPEDTIVNIVDLQKGLVSFSDPVANPAKVADVVEMPKK